MRIVVKTLLIILLLASATQGATITSTATGDWSAGGTWVGGIIPANADDFVIAAGHVVTLDKDNIGDGVTLGASTIEATATLICSTATGTYSLLMSGDLDVDGTLQAGTSVGTPLPADVTFTIDFNGGSNSIVGSATGRIYFYCLQPDNYWIKLSAQEAAGQTELSVDTDVTSDTAWVDGADILIVDTDGLDEEERIIDAGGIAAGAITVTVALANQKEEDAYLVLLSRNIKLINSTDYILKNVVSSVVNCEIVSTGFAMLSVDLNTFTGSVISGTRAAYTSDENTFNSCVFSPGGLTACRGNEVNGSFFEGGSQLFQAYANTLNDCIFNNDQVLNQTRGSIFNRCTMNGAACVLSSFSNTLNTCTVNSNLGLSAAYSNTVISCVFTGTTAIERSYFNSYYDCDFSGVATENSGYNTVAALASYYEASDNHDQISNAYKAWCRGGIVTSQIGGSPPTGFTIWYEHACEDTTTVYPCFRQFTTVVQPGTAIEVEGYIRIQNGENLTSDPPYLAIVDKFADVLVDSTQTNLDKCEIPNPTGDATWQYVSVIWANTGDSPRTVIVRMYASVANVGADVDVDEVWAIADYKDQINTILSVVRPVGTVVSTSDTTTSFTITGGLATADSYNNMAIQVQDADDAGDHWIERQISDWTAGKVVTVDTAFPFAPAVDDKVRLVGTVYGGGGGGSVDKGAIADEVVLHMDANSTDLNTIITATVTTIPALITATGPTAHDCDSVTPTTGTVTGGDTHTDTHSDDGSSYQVAPVSPAVGGFGLNQIFVYTIGVGRVPVSISVNGYFDASSPNNDDRAVEVWVYNYTTSNWKQISELGTHMDDETGHQDYQYVLGEGDYQVSDGEVQIRFTSTSTTAADAMYLDHLILSSVAQAAAGLTTDAIEQAVWNHDLEDHEGSTTGAALASSVVYPGIVSTMDSATSFTSSGLPSIADLYNGYVLNIHDISGDIQESKVIIDMDNAGVLILDSALSFTPAVGDHIHIRTIVSSEHLYEIYTDQKDGGRLDLIWDAIKYKTDLISLVDTVVKDANDANNFTIEDGTDVNDAYWFMAIQVEDADDNLSKEIRWISFYDENSGDPNLWVDEPFSFTPAVNDVVHIMGTTYGGYLYQIMRNLAQTRGVLNVVDQSKSGTGGLDRAGAIRIDALGDDP